MFYDNLQNACKLKGVKITNVLKELKISSGNLSKWKNGVVPKSGTIKVLSEYFDVSTDYLIDGKTKKAASPQISDDTAKALKLFSSLSDEDQKWFLQMMQSRLNNTK